MFVVVAGARDLQSRALAKHWAPYEVGVLTPNDLCSVGWSFDPAAPERSSAVVDGRLISTSAIRGVLVRLSAITPRDLPQIAAEEREYVAAEITAFLVSWLASLSCVVLNPPQPPSLTSPVWTPEQWLLTAAKLGIPLADARTRTSYSQPRTSEFTVGAEVAVTVIGTRCVGFGCEALWDDARRLAHAGGVALLDARFAQRREGFRFVTAHPWADIGNEAVRAAVLAHFVDGRAGPLGGRLG